ncbi:hypothetical protein BH09ACT1_BH09ACT1_12520 [soil metagenome]
MVTPLGVLVILIAAAVVGRSKGYVRLMAVGGGMPIGVVVVLGGQSLPVFYTLAIGTLLALFLVPIITRKPSAFAALGGPRPGAIALLLFVAWSAIITLIAPALFAGMPVLIARDGLDEGLLNPGTLGYTVSNIAQVAYLVLGAGTVFFLSRSKGSTPGLIGFMLGTVTILSFWRYTGLHYNVPFPYGFFDNSTAVRIIESTSTGEARFRGIFSEPSGLASASLTAMIYFAMRFKWLRGWKLVLAIAIFVMAAINALVSTAGTFVAAGLLMLAILCAVGIWKFVSGGVRLNATIVIIAMLVVSVGVFFLPAVISVISGIINNKVGSSSYDSRTGVDQFSILLAIKTWGLGVGLGSNRPSSFLAMLLSCVGVPGTALFFVAIGSIMKKAYQIPQYRATVWALTSVLASKVISGPNLSDPSALLWISAGVLAHAAWYPAEAAGDIIPIQPRKQAEQFSRQARRELVAQRVRVDRELRPQALSRRSKLTAD